MANDLDLILLTGATGFLGYRVLINALKDGYRVRCAVRSASGIDRILASRSLKELGPLARKLSWVIVPDIAAPGAYDEAVTDVQYIVHIASPVDTGTGGSSASGSEEETFIKPAVSGVVGMLESAAAHSPKLRRIVVTSSVVAIFPWAAFTGQVPEDAEPFTAENRLPTPKPPYSPGYAYFASKIAALNAAEEWMKKNSPPFDMINIIPTWIWGRHELATSTEQLISSSNGILLNLLTGNDQMPFNSAAVSVQAAAKAHLLALQPSVPGNQSFLAGKLENLKEANRIAQKHFPDAFTSGVFTEDSNQVTLRIPMDAEKSETVLGLKLDSLEDMVKEVAAQYLELS